MGLKGFRVRYKVMGGDVYLLSILGIMLGHSCVKPAFQSDLLVKAAVCTAPASGRCHYQLHYAENVPLVLQEPPWNL